MRLFLAQGFEKTTVDQIAAAAAIWSTVVFSNPCARKSRIPTAPTSARTARDVRSRRDRCPVPAGGGSWAEVSIALRYSIPNTGVNT